MSLFEKGRPKTGGRAKGARNKLSTAFLEAMAADFEEHGAEVIKIARMERPTEYLKVAASLLPKEFEITERPATPPGRATCLARMNRRRVALHHNTRS